MSGKIELLAPAKNKEVAFSAIDCGADAVYIGAPAFGARHNAANSLEDIKEVVNYAHKFWAKVHVTVNTILTDSELDEAVKLVKKLYNIGVDAVIIQDFGLLEKLMKETNIPVIHMSTQCDNYLPQKIKFFNDIGISRVVLARELSIEQIKKIHEQNPNLELESFIHGALCVSMSGQCYLSQYIGGRSANRGECAQPCRKKYDVINNEGNIIAKNIYALCLKDFNGSKHINELIESGITSFKIEGRLKDTGYVKNIVAYYRNLIPSKTSSGKSVYAFLPNPDKTFNRGFTDYFLNRREECFNFESPKSKGEYLGEVIKVNRDSFVIKTNIPLNPQDGLYFNDDGCLINRIVQKNDIAEIYPNRKVQVLKGLKIYRNLDSEFEKALLKPVKRQLGLDIRISNVIKIIDEDGVCITKALPAGEKPQNEQKAKENFLKQLSKTGGSDFYIKNVNVAETAKLPFLPVREINEFRRSLFNDLMTERLKIYDKNRQLQPKLKYTQFYRKEIDYRGNIHNNYAKIFYEKCGVTVKELSFESEAPNRQVELMRCKHCIKYALKMCKSPKNLLLRDSHNKTYPLKFNCKACEMSVMNP